MKYKVLVVIIFVSILAIILGMLSNNSLPPFWPISISEYAAKYIDEKYGDDYSTSFVRYIREYDDYEPGETMLREGFKFPCYLFSVKSNKSEDSNFCVGIHGFEIHDTFDLDVTSLRNTKDRLDDELGNYLRSIYKEQGFDDLGYISGFYIYNKNNIGEFLYLNMSFDKELPFEVHITVNDNSYIHENNATITQTINEMIRIGASIGFTIKCYHAMLGEYPNTKYYVIPYEETEMDNNDISPNKWEVDGNEYSRHIYSHQDI